MTLRNRILSLITLALLLSIAAGSVLTYWHSNKKVSIEMEAALAVGEGAVRDAVEPLARNHEPARQIQRIVASFNGNRHLQAFWIGPTGVSFAESKLLPPTEPMPEWFFNIFAGQPHESIVAFPSRMADMGHIRLATNSRSEVGEVWEDISLKILIVAAFSGLVLSLVYSAIGHALRPLDNLSLALSRVGEGDYEAQVPTTGPSELSSIYKDFNGMAGQLLDMARRNARLNDQLMSVQEEERADIARDLHDEFGPFLFSIDVDARAIRKCHDGGGGAVVGEGADSIRSSVAHLQKHLKSILGKLRPAVLLDLGLSHALDHLVEFWSGRHPGINFGLNMKNATFGERIDTICFRVVQESLNNAVRHGKPSHIDIDIRVVKPAMLRISVTDDGDGKRTSEDKATVGFGLAGMRERLNSAGGTLNVGNRSGCAGFEVVALLPLRGEVIEQETADDRRGISDLEELWDENIAC
ncbi:MAG: HAMP domain-containing protein [Hyphomicrobium sp.]